MGAGYSIETCARSAGAIGIVRLVGDDLDRVLRALGLPCAPVGSVVLTDLLGVDRGLLARWDDSTADLMLHGGPGVIEAAVGVLSAAGVGPAARASWPESSGAVEAEALEALAGAASPAAVPLLLAQAERHARAPEGPFAPAELDRLLTPPLVLITGAPNVGKSSLLNALAGREAALTADMPGTTRDAVGVTAVLDGLAVRLVDAPGFDAAEPDPIVRAASAIAAGLEANADLVLRCDDGRRAPTTTERPSLSVRTKADLPPAAATGAIAVSSTTGAGLDALAVSVRRALVPDSALADPRPWRFIRAARG